MSSLSPEALAAYQAARFGRNKSVFCHAPFGSMTFGWTGNASVCCCNRKEVLGTYPKDSLIDMWRGPGVRAMRSAMASFAPPPGCEVCVQQMEIRNFGGMRAYFFDEVGDDPFPAPGEDLWPQMMEFEISNLCNLECIMCNGDNSSLIRRNREKQPPIRNPYDRAFVDQIEEFIPRLKLMKFLGGEPFLNKIYFGIWDRVAALKPEIAIHIVTNGTILNDRVKNILERITPRIVLSIDSLERENYEKIRLNADYDGMRRNLDYFFDLTRRKGDTPKITVCPMIQNWMDLPGLLKFCNEKDAYLRINTVVDPHWVSLRYQEPSTVSEIADFLERSLEPANTAVARENVENFRGMIRLFRLWSEPKAPEKANRSSPCEAGPAIASP